MTVVLVGVGSDSEHARPSPRIDSGVDTNTSRFRRPGLRQSRGPMFLFPSTTSPDQPSITSRKSVPSGRTEIGLTDKEIFRNHPLHYDPDFESMTFCDRLNGTGGTISQTLGSGDGLGVYTSLRDPDGELHYNIHVFSPWLRLSICRLLRVPRIAIGSGIFQKA